MRVTQGLDGETLLPQLREWAKTLGFSQIGVADVDLHDAEPGLQQWLLNGFHGTMGELLSAIAENREPSNSARNNLASLSLCFAAVASAECGEALRPGTVRQLHIHAD